MKNEISEKELLQLEARGQLLPVNQTPVVNPALMPRGAPPSPQAQPPNLSGTIPANLQTPVDLLNTQYGPSVPTFRLAPVGPAGIPSINTSGQNQAEPANQKATVAQKTATSAQGTANSAQQTANQAIAKSFQGAWSGAVQYLVGASVDSDGSIYLCIAANTNQVPPNATYWTLLSGSTSYAGTWSSATAYTTGEIVSVSTSLYIALQNSTNENPASTTGYWQILSGTSFYYGAWSSSDAYPVGAQTSYQGNFYVATTANTNQTPSTTSAYWTLVGTSAILIGTWSSSTAYVAGNEVTYQPSGGAVNYYVALQASTNQNPATASAYWYLISNNTAINSASSYRPTTNPLTATDAGASATITIASFTMNVAGIGAVSVSGGTLSGLSYGTIYYIFYADPAIAGGGVTFQETTTKTSTISAGVNFFVGSILTPQSVAPNTIGFNDGGATSQTGFASNLFAGVVTPSSAGDWTNISNANDGNFTTYATGNVIGLALHNMVVSGFSGIAPTYTSVVLNVITWPYAISGASSFVRLDYSTNGGQTWNNIYQTSSNASSPRTDQVTLSNSQNIGAVQIRVELNSAGSGDNSEVLFYEAWLAVAG